MNPSKKISSRTMATRIAAIRAPLIRLSSYGYLPYAYIAVKVLSADFHDILTTHLPTIVSLKLGRQDQPGHVKVNAQGNAIRVTGGAVNIVFQLSQGYYPVGIAFNRTGKISRRFARQARENFPGDRVFLWQNELYFTDIFATANQDEDFKFNLVIQNADGQVGITDPIITNEA